MPPDSKETKIGISDKEASSSAGKNAGVVLVTCWTGERVPTAISGGVGIEVPKCHLLRQLIGGFVDYIKDWCLMNSQFDLFLTQWIMVILSKGCNWDNFESDISLKLSFTNIQVFCPTFVECKSFLGSNSPDILALCEKLCMLLHFMWKMTSFRAGPVSTKPTGLLLVFLAGFTSIIVLLHFPLSTIFFVYMHGFRICFIWHIWGFLDQPVC